MNELKKCPVCGGEAEIVEHEISAEKFFPGDKKFEVFKDWVIREYGVKCRRCNASSFQGYRTEKEAITAWNRRANDE